MEHDPDCDKDLAAAEIVKCSLLMQHCPFDSSKVQVKMHQVVHKVFRKYLLDKYSEEQIAELILLYIEILSTSAQHDPLHFDLNFHMTSKMLAPHLKTLCHRPSPVWKLVLAKNSERNSLPSIFFSFGDICWKHFFLLEAGRYFRKALQIVKDGYDSDDKNKINFIATILNNQGLIFHVNDEYEKAELYYKRALDILRALHPPNTSLPEIVDSLNKLGTLYYKISYREIADRQRERRDYVLQQYGLEPSKLATPFYDDNSYMEKAKYYFQQSLDMRKEFYGLEHPEVAASLANVGCIHCVMGDLETAKEFFQSSHALRKNMYGEEHPCVADSLNNLGILHSKIGLKMEAVQYQEKALEMRKKLFYHDHAVIADSYNNLALAYQYNDQLEQAKECFEKALGIRERVSGEKHPLVAALLFNFSDLCLSLGEMKKCKELYDRARQIVNPFKRPGLLDNEFIPHDEPFRHFKSRMQSCSRYGYAVGEGILQPFDPLPPERYPITCTAERP